MRPLIAIGLPVGVFSVMASAAHLQFNSDAIGIESAQAQVLEASEYQELEALPDNWRNPNGYPQEQAVPKLEYVTSEAEAKAIVSKITGEVKATYPSPSPLPEAPIQNVNLTTAQVKVAGSDCSTAIANAEVKYGIPPHMLKAIALTESGRDGEPYPWAMNIMGKAHYASSPQEIVNIVNRYGSRSSIDIGCSQVNLKYHGHRFRDWKSLIDPQTNADYAAYHLLELRREFGSWSKAVSAYHSRTSWRGANYACTVSKNYGKIFGDNRKGCGPDIEILAAHLQRNQNLR